MANAESGMDRNTAKRSAHAAEKDQNHQAGERQADRAFIQQVWIASFTKADWSKTTLVVSCLGRSNRFGEHGPDSVDHLMVLVSPPCFMIGR